MDKENVIQDLIDKIHDLNNLINNNHDYMMNIIKEDKKNHSKNFRIFNEIKKLYDIIIDIYQSNYENNEYLFKCIFDITIKYVSNIAGFFIYLNLFDQFKTGIITNEQVIKTCNTVKKKIGFEIQNYTSMLDIFHMDKMLSISNIRNIEIIISPVDSSIRLSSHNMNTSKINNLMIYLRNLMFQTIKKIIELDDKTNENSSNFITIPQNASMCVFISMLTGLCYSDLNKSLIQQKLSRRQSITNDFKKMVYYIIANITSIYKQYDITDTILDCDILDFLKKEPYNTLNKLTTIIFNDIFLANYIKTSKIFIDNNIIKISKDVFENFINYLEFNYSYSKYGYFIDLINMNLKENGDYYELNYDFENDYKMAAEDMRFLIYLYELLDIKAKHIYSNDKNEYWEYVNEEIEKQEEDPEILILQHFTKISLNSFYIQEMEGDLIIEEDGIIIYNGIKYKLDYILHYNDIEKCKNKKCYHCISGITYNNQDYIYDSDKKSDVVRCDNGEDYMIPCSLLKQNWNKNINKDITYCTTKCKYNLECKIDTVYDNNLCYTFHTNITYVYVKL
jgi:hypothetical protein